MSKYRAKRTEVDGIFFASKKEARRYIELKCLEKAGHIKDMKLQPKFPIEVRGKKICTYVADFTYFHCGIKEKVVEDVKGFITPVYKLKRKLMKAVHGIDILET